MTRLARLRERRRRAIRRTLAAVASAAALVALGAPPGSIPLTSAAARSGDGAAAAVGPAGRPAGVAALPARAVVAKLMVATVARSAPGGSGVVARLDTSVRAGGGPTDLLVLGSRRVAGQKWLRVLLPIRPNGSTGWIGASTAVTHATPWRIVVSTESRTVQVLRAGRAVRTFSAVVGAPATPTPHGLFAVLERIPLADPDGFYGSWILTITGHSNVYRTFQGGDGRVAIHGRGGASLASPLGSAASNGCVRMDNAGVDWLAGVAAPGTPVVIE
jgi:lipoprotein-anchoring transpeptidase ErfK/SrfK